MDNQKIIDTGSIFDRRFIDSKSFYMYCYNQVPCITWVDMVNIDKILVHLKSKYSDAITGIYQWSKYDWKTKKPDNWTTMITMKENCLIELSGSCCDIFHTHENYEMANTLIKELSRFKRKEKKNDFEINMIFKNNDELVIRSLDIKKTKLDLDLYYEDDFLEVDRIIQNRLNKKKDKGIVLLHGLPGTGKTTYLRYLVGKLKKKTLFLPPAIANNITSPQFMELLVDNPDSVLVIEDAENIIMDRRVSSDSSVSNLLNISDGLLSDFLNVQLICTFNHPLSMIDNALMRKGRLIAKYEFRKLGIAKAQQLSNKLGFDTQITKPMTIAEIANQHEKEQQPAKMEVIGFRQHIIQN